MACRPMSGGLEAGLVAGWPKGGRRAWGLAQQASGLLVLWEGHARVLIVDPATGAIREAETKGEAARAMRDAKRPGKVYSKWRYVPEVDAFFGITNVDLGFVQIGHASCRERVCQYG